MKYKSLSWRIRRLLLLVGYIVIVPLGGARELVAIEIGSRGSVNRCGRVWVVRGWSNLKAWVGGLWEMWLGLKMGGEIGGR